MRSLLLALLGLLAACVEPPVVLPEGARPDLGREWLEGVDYRWPPRDGFAEAPTYIVLPPGVLLDRFGSDRGRFFSPKGVRFSARSLATVCAEQPYAIYRIVTPLLVRVGSATPWFQQLGGATQVMTDASAAQLVADGVLERIPAGRPDCS